MPKTPKRCRSGKKVKRSCVKLNCSLKKRCIKKSCVKKDCLKKSNRSSKAHSKRYHGHVRPTAAELDAERKMRDFKHPYVAPINHMGDAISDVIAPPLNVLGGMLDGLRQLKNGTFAMGGKVYNTFNEAATALINAKNLLMDTYRTRQAEEAERFAADAPTREILQRRREMGGVAGLGLGWGPVNP